MRLFWEAGGGWEGLTGKVFVDVDEMIETNAALSEPVFFTPSVVVPNSDLVESHLGERTKGNGFAWKKKG